VLILTKFIFSFYLNFDEIYPIFWGYKFDFAISAILSFFVMLFSFNKKLSKTIFIFLITLLFLTQISDILYFSESRRHIGYEVKDLFTDFLPLINTALNKYLFITIISIMITLIMIKLLSKIVIYERFDRYFILKVLASLIISVFFIRGEFQHIPLHPYQANEIGDIKKAQVALNGTYNILYSLSRVSKTPKMLPIGKISDSDIKKSLQEIYQNDKKQLPYSYKKPNIVLFFLESWSAKWLKPYGFNKETTPNFNYFYKKGIKPKFMVANGHRTTEGIFAVLTSYPNPLGKSIAKTNLQNFSYDSLIYLFNDLGYESIFFQGTNKDTSGTGSLAQYLGFKKSFGKRDIKKRLYPENYWGVQDTDLYNFVLKKLPKNKPFIIGINGATTHDNVVPKEFKTKNFTNDEKLNKELNALYFSDFALGEFIRKIEKKYPNTIFVLFADHCGGRIKGTLENYKIPFVIYHNKIKPKKYDTIISQLDIAPTILDIVGIDYQKAMPNATGKSLLSDDRFFAPYFHNGIIGWIEEGKRVEYNIQNKELKCSLKKATCDKLKNHLKSWSYITQKLLFEGKTKEFHKWRNFYE
jgi:phosphoglycerol transferase MdoB-like AlkP superfamily enzyme